MQFEWDQAKSHKTRAERGFGFDFAVLVFAGRTLEAPDTRKDYGEVRVRALGAVGSDVLVVTYTDRGTRRRIISARLANRKGAHTMARRSMTLAEAVAGVPEVDRAKMDATTEAGVEQHMGEDGELSDITTAGALLVLPATAVRKQLGMSQPQFASLIGVPVATLRNWEQGRVLPDPAARTLLTILAREPQAALRALLGAA